MTKKLRVILVSIVAVLLLLFGYTVYANKIPAKEENKAETLWQLVDKMDSLRTLKEECVNNLNIVDSAKFLKWYSGYCDSRDAEIIELREKVNHLSKKDYEGLE